MLPVVSVYMLPILIKLALVTANPVSESAYKLCNGLDAKESPPAYLCG